MKKQQKKVRNGWTMQGQCFQWMMDNKEMSRNEKSIYASILRRSFGYTNRVCYMKYDEFDISNRNTIKATIDSLMQRGIISKKSTFKDGKQGYNMYGILEPSVLISNFEFGKTIEVKEPIKEDNPWI